MPLGWPHLLAERKPTAIVANGRHDAAARLVRAHLHRHGLRLGMMKRVVQGLLQHEQQVSRHERREIVGGRVERERRRCVVARGGAVDEFPQGDAKRAAIGSKRPERPHGAPELAGGMVHHFSCHAEMLAHPVRRDGGISFASTAIRRFAHLQLKIDPAHSLQDRVVEVGGEVIPLAECHFVFNCCFAASGRLLDGDRGLPAHLAPQGHGPGAGDGRQPRQPRCRRREPPRRPPRRRSDEPDVAGIPHQQLHATENSQRPVAHPLL